MAERIRWGIIGTGRIARQFAQGLKELPDAELVAVGSRSQDKADDFGREFNVVHRHASYEALVENAAVDAVYVATPHSSHAENTLSALEAGKAVLCEKPFAINAREAERMIQTARAKRLLLMEAMWTRFLPVFVRLRELLSKGTIGEVRTLEADLSFQREARSGRLFDPALGGGALLDIGIYPLSLASMLFGSPTEAHGVAEMGPTGVDEQNVIVLKHPQGQLAALHTSIRAFGFQEANIVGTKGRIRLHRGWWRGPAMTVTLDAGGEELIDDPYTSTGYQFEAAAFMDCLREGKLESPVIPLDETLSLMRTMDGLRKQWGLKYPME
jgi:predicted dehydrogenase